MTRLRYAALGAATVALGLLVHLGGRGVLPPAVRDVLGDALWAAMILWAVSAAAPRARRAGRAAVAYAVCAAVEAGQLIRHPGLDAVRRTPLGHLALGSDFDPRDLAAYALGVLAATALDARLARRRAGR